jgi:hypothetical protein
MVCSVWLCRGLAGSEETSDALPRPFPAGEGLAYIALATTHAPRTPAKAVVLVVFLVVAIKNIPRG